MSQKSTLRPVADHISDEIRQTLSHPLRNLRVSIRKETKKGIYTTVIDLRSEKNGNVVARKSDHSLLKSINRAKQALYRQIEKHHERQRRKYSPLREHYLGI